MKYNEKEHKKMFQLRPNPDSTQTQTGKTRIAVEEG